MRLTVSGRGIRLNRGFSGTAAGSYLGCEHKDYKGDTAYYDRVQIGLAPGGKIAVWLQGSGSEPNYRVTPSVLYTLSGDNLDICKGITKHPDGYKYYGDTEAFIKGKKYPYGRW